ncbi:MAG: segregation/condensation protein A [Firmicutes bacterium]|nr:segregation/condensation protein A [Bacillota bacterium]
MSYKVRLDLFEGPFELLIYLIEHARMSVYDIKVSEITTQYLEYVSKLQEIDPQLAQEFMVLAAELIEIKSRMLLPGRQKEEGEAEEDDPRTGLVQRILEYKQFRELASMLDDRQEQTSHMHVKPREDLSRWTG